VPLMKITIELSFAVVISVVLILLIVALAAN
jgi:hypothetical protein